MWSFPAKIWPKYAKHYHITWRLWAFKTSTFGITWCDHFWPNLRLEVAEVFHIRWRMLVAQEIASACGCDAVVHSAPAERWFRLLLEVQVFVCSAILPQSWQLVLTSFNGLSPIQTIIFLLMAVDFQTSFSQLRSVSVMRIPRASETCTQHFSMSADMPNGI